MRAEIKVTGDRWCDLIDAVCEAIKALGRGLTEGRNEGDRGSISFVVYEEE
jgi:hypothetical protein